MSFILDALKKAERDRSRVPTLVTEHGWARHRGRTIGVWVTTGLLLVGGGAAGWLLWPSPNPVPPAATESPSRTSQRSTSQANPESKIISTKPDDSTQSPSVTRLPQNPDIGRRREVPRQPGNVNMKDPEALQATPNPSSNVSVPAGVPSTAGNGSAEQRRAENTPVETRRVEPPAVGMSPEISRPTVLPPPSEAKASPGANQARGDVVAPPVPPLPAKPSTLQDALAKMRLDVFVYTGVKADRMVVINGRRYAEGQYVDGVYLLEEITSEGAVLSYQGERALLRP